MVFATIALFVLSFGYGVVVPALPRLMGTGIAGDVVTPAALSAIYVTYSTCKIATQVPAGAWVDRVGHALAIRVALVLFTISLVPFVVPSSFGWVALARAIEGVATGLCYPAVFARVFTLAEGRNVGKQIGAVVGIGTAGLLVGPAVGAALSHFGPHLPVIVALALSVVVTAIAFVPSRGSKGVLPENERAPRSVRDDMSVLIRTARDRKFVGLLLPIAFNKLIFSSFQALLPLAGVAVLGAGPKGVALLFIVTGVVFAAAQPVGGAIGDRFGALRVVAFIAPGLLVSLALLAATNNYILFAAIYAFHILTQSLIFTTIMKKAAMDHGTADTYGSVYGVLGTLTDTMTIVGPALFLPIYGWIGGRVFLLMAVTGIAFHVGSMWLNRAPHFAASSK